MTRLLRRLRGFAYYCGLDVRRLLAARFLGRYLRDYLRYRRLADRSPRIRDLHPILYDYNEPAGHARGHYFYQDIWAARHIYRRKPEWHVDIGSRVDGFISHLLVFRNVTVVDIRSLDQEVQGLEFVRGDATDLKAFQTHSVPSLSCLHALEHFGLGRYGDSVQPRAWRDALTEMLRVLTPHGILYVSVPIGRERVQFNAQRVFDPVTILKACDGLELVSFAAIDDDGIFVARAKPEEFRESRFACGCFEFRARRGEGR